MRWRPFVPLLLLPACAAPTSPPDPGPDTEREADVDLVDDDKFSPWAAGDLRQAALASPDGLGPGARFTLPVEEAGATFVKLRFARVELQPGDRLLVADAAGEVVDSFVEGGTDLWALSADGTTALVTLEAGPAEGPRGFAVDQIARGLEPDPGAPPDRTQLPSICGGSDLRPAACFDGAIFTAADAVGAMRFVKGGKTYVCTGFLVSAEGHFLTNNHCVSTAQHVDSLEVRFRYQTPRCDRTGSPASVRFKARGLLRTSRPLDYSLVKLPADAPARFGYLRLAPVEPTEGTAIYIPQHPGGRKKEIAVRDSRTSGPCKVRSTDRARASDFGYHCDTEKGSSGSPVLRAADHQVLGLHHLGGCQNAAVSMRSIHREIGSLLPADGGAGDPPPPDDPGDGGGGGALERTLEDGTPIGGLSGGRGSLQYFRFEVPAGSDWLELEIGGPRGDADLYVRHAARPTLSTFDYRKVSEDSTERVALNYPRSGTWYLLVHGYDAFSSLTIQARRGRF